MIQLFCAFLLFNSPKQWSTHVIKEKTADCSRHIYRSDDPVTGIDIEILCRGDETTTYFQVHSQSISLAKEDPTRAKVKFSTQKEQFIFLAQFHQGRQRIHLNPSIQSQFFVLLQAKEPILIEMEGYREVVKTEHLQKTLNKLFKAKRGNSIMKKKVVES